MSDLRGVRVYTVLGPDTLELPKVARFLGREVEITIRPVPSIEEVRAMNSGFTGSIADDIIADREDRF